jgi:hypothetical protein
MAELLFAALLIIALMITYIVWNQRDLKGFLRSISGKYGLLFRVTTSIALILILIGVTLTIKTQDPNLLTTERTKFFIGGLVAIGLFYTILAFEFNVKKSKQDRRSQLSQSTFSILSAWYNTPIVDYSKTISLFEKGANHKHLKNNIDAFLQWFDSDDKDAIELRRAIGGVFNYFEIICTGIKEQIIDEQFVKRYYEEVFNDYYNDWIGYINKRRGINGGMFSEFTTLVENWNKK